MKRKPPFMIVRRTECERQRLISEYRRLRAEGVNVDRQEAVLGELRRDWEFGWPPPRPWEPGWKICWWLDVYCRLSGLDPLKFHGAVPR